MIVYSVRSLCKFVYILVSKLSRSWTKARDAAALGSWKFTNFEDWGVLSSYVGTPHDSPTRKDIIDNICQSWLADSVNIYSCLKALLQRLTRGT